MQGFYHCLINGVFGLIRKDAGGQAGNNFDHGKFMGGLQHVVIDVDIVSLEGTDIKKQYITPQIPLHTHKHLF